MYESLPKVVLHFHLDGALRPETILELADDCGYRDLPTADSGDLADWFDQGESGSLERYLEAFHHTVAVMQTRQAMERVAYEAALDLAADGVIYAEVRFAPTLNAQGGLSRHETVEAALAGLQRAEEEAGIVTRVILCAMRDQDDSETVARVAADLRRDGAVGFDLAGPERDFPADRHLAACRLAAESLVRITLHAGEADGPNSIWRAVTRCGAERVGHGIHIIDDCTVEDGEITQFGPVAAYVRDRRIPLEVCPYSNLHTHGWEPREHPVGMLYRAGFAVTISTDNPLMSRTSMSREFELLAEHHGFTTGDLAAVTETAMRSAFCSLDVQERLLARIRAGYDA